MRTTVGLLPQSWPCLTLLLLLAGLVSMPAESLFASSATAAHSLIGVSWDGFSYRINPLNGDYVELSRPDIRFNSLARDPAGNFVAGGGGPDDHLYRIDPTNGTAQLLVHITNPQFETIRGLAYSPNGDLFAIERPWSTSTGFSDNYLYKLDVNTGAATFIGTTGMRGLQSLAISDAGTMYSFDIEGSGRGLVTIDPVSGVASDVNPLDNAQGSAIQSLAFAHDGTLYAMGQGAIYTVNVSNGALTKLTDFSTDIRGIEFLPVPEPCSLALLVLALGVVCLDRGKRQPVLTPL